MMGRSRNTGFTLVEMLLAITLMATLLALAYGGLSAATKASDKGQELLKTSGKIRITQQFIRRQINQMLPLPFDEIDDAAATRVVFEGGGQRIQYVAPMPGYLGAGGPQVQVMEFVEEERGLSLHFYHALLLEFDPEYLYEREPVVLLEGVLGAQFQFLGRDDDGDITGWSASWDDPSVLPVAVRLDLEFTEEYHAFWPSLATGIRLDEMAVAQTAASRDYGTTIREMIRNRGRETE